MMAATENDDLEEADFMKLLDAKFNSVMPILNGFRVVLKEL